MFCEDGCGVGLIPAWLAAMHLTYRTELLRFTCLAVLAKHWSLVNQFYNSCQTSIWERLGWIFRGLQSKLFDACRALHTPTRWFHWCRGHLLLADRRSLRHRRIRVIRGSRWKMLLWSYRSRNEHRGLDWRKERFKIIFRGIVFL
jgi:hypothetical protein